MKKLHKSQIISKLVVTKLLRTITLLMRNFLTNFVKILEICKNFAGNRVNNLGNIPQCGVVPKCSDPEVIALGITADVFGFDSDMNASRQHFLSSTIIFMIILNYAKRPCVLFTRVAGKIVAMTFMQYVNFVNHRPIGQIKYSLI